MDRSDRCDEDAVALSSLAEAIRAAAVPEYLKRQPNLAFLTQEQLAERWGVGVDMVRDYRARGGAILDYERANRIEFNGAGILSR